MSLYSRSLQLEQSMLAQQHLAITENYVPIGYLVESHTKKLGRADRDTPCANTDLSVSVSDRVLGGDWCDSVSGRGQHK